MKNNNFKETSAFLSGEEPLLAIDDKLRFYATRNKFKLTKNYHLWPERSFSWKDKSVNKQIQIYLKKDGKDFMIWGCVYKDLLFGKRYVLKQKAKNIRISSEGWDEVKVEIDSLKDKLNKIGKSDLI